MHRLLLNKYYVDEVYDATIVQPIKVVSTEGLWRGFDVKVVDGAVNGAGYLVSGVSIVLRLLQNGSVKTYAASMFVGAVAVLGLLPSGDSDNVPGLLTLAITLPIIGAVLLMFVPNRDGSKDGLVRYLALGVSLVDVRGHAGAVGRIRSGRGGRRRSSSSSASVDSARSASSTTSASTASA